jgi:hypothetical protein
MCEGSIYQDANFRWLLGEAGPNLPLRSQGREISCAGQPMQQMNPRPRLVLLLLAASALCLWVMLIGSALLRSL